MSIVRRLKLHKVKPFVKAAYNVFFPCSGFHKEEKALFKWYYHAIGRKNIRETLVVVMVGGRYVHGGLSDCLRGIVGVHDVYMKSFVDLFMLSRAGKVYFNITELSALILYKSE